MRILKFESFNSDDANLPEYRNTELYKNIMGDNEKCCDRCTGKKGCSCCRDCKCNLKFNDATGLAD